jgi:hypothetical protein
MDVAIRLVYGKHPPSKSANLENACRIACEELLVERVNASEVQSCAKGLFNSPVPYSTHDLAVSVSLNFFKRAELVDRLRDAQLNARMKVATWTKEGKVAGLLAQSFEAVLCKQYE